MLGRCPPRWLWGHTAPGRESLLPAETPNTDSSRIARKVLCMPPTAQGCRLGLAGEVVYAHLGGDWSTHWAHGDTEFDCWALTSLKYTLTRRFWIFFLPCNWSGFILMGVAKGYPWPEIRHVPNAEVLLQGPGALELLWKTSVSIY